MKRLFSRLVALVSLTLAVACSEGPTSPGTSHTATGSSSPVYVVLFTHIEDNTPVGSLGSSESRVSYLNWRSDIIAMAELARQQGVPWSFQPDWKFLEAARLFEDSATMASTGGVNVLRYLRDTLGVTIDPHSHEMSGYNYTDVAYLLDRLGVGGSTVIGGHVWDPSLPEFAEWDRYRTSVRGERYPQALWRGDILMGAGTPGHRNDPVVSGVWRPRDRHNYFTDDPTGNMYAIGGWSQAVSAADSLYELGRTGAVPSGCMLTLTHHIRPADIATASALAAVDRDVLTPALSLRAQGKVVLTDFTSLVNTWRSEYGSKGCAHRQ